MGATASTPCSKVGTGWDGVLEQKAERIDKETETEDKFSLRGNLFFPNEILEKILSFLSVRDMLIAREVCLDWMHHINSTDYLQDRMKIRISSDELRCLADSPLDPVFTSFIFHNIDVTRQSMRFWSLYSDIITHLDFYKSSVIPRNTVNSMQADFMLGCPNLKHLGLVNCDKYFLMGGNFIQLHEILCLENLESLDLSKNQNLTDGILFSILLKTKKLKSLDLSDCSNMVFMKAVHNRFYPASAPRPIMYSDHVLSFHTLCKDFLFTEKARCMKNFNFGMKFNSTGMNLILDIDNITWEVVNLESPELKVTDVKDFLTKFNASLIKLELGRCKVSSTDIFAANLYRLERFSVHDSRTFTNLDFLHTMPNLHELTLDGISGFDLNYEALRQKVQLSALSLNGIKPNGDIEICREVLRKCIPQLKNLRSLELGNCSSLVDNEIVQTIIVHLKQLRKLNLEAAAITDFALTGLVAEEECDEALDCAIDGLKLNTIKWGEHNLSSLADLEWLSLSHCRNLSDLTWLTAFKLPSLVSLNLSNCSTLSKKGILSIISTCRNLENLVLIHCSRQILTDSEVINAAREQLYRCKGITY
ncbi:F-box/LRR-repeat protein 14 [Orchesella cincta]|uniref:F-box/LRR-repeat protein 14 n=1 Tax=Orchesella cincta TaxID=48709 RepID=A0A1D2NKH6_ORCCI|nr:F-box/LRR-repeat protein 14 [Orchesella cincta]